MICLIVFQILLLLLLALPVLAASVGLVVLAVAYAVVFLALVYSVLNFEARVRPVAGVFLGFFALLSLGATGALLAGASVFWIAGVVAVWLALFFVGMAWKFSTADCELLGWTNGYAVVKVVPSLVSVLPPGVYAAECEKKPVKKTVRVQFSFLDKKGRVV